MPTDRYAELALRHAPGAKAVAFGSESTHGIVRLRDELVLEGVIVAGVVSAVRVLVVPTGALSASHGDVLTVGGQEHEVREGPLRIRDGELSVFGLLDGV